MIRLSLDNGTYLGERINIDDVNGVNSYDELLQEIDDLLDELKDMNLNGEQFEWIYAISTLLIALEWFGKMFEPFCVKSFSLHSCQYFLRLFKK